MVTKQAFDKSELINEIGRAKKELAFANKKLHHQKAEGAGRPGKDGPDVDDIQNSIKLVETISIQKKALEDENEDLKSKISELMNDRSQFFQQSEAAHPIGPMAGQDPDFGDQRRNIPKLSLGGQGGIY